ncbi:MAG: hypothetical protein ACJAZN_000736, partial [Planctomycetota bacterium]
MRKLAAHLLSLLSRPLLPVAAAAALLGPSCSQDGARVPECSCIAPLNVTVLMQGGEFDELLTLHVLLEEIRILRADESSNGVDGANLLKTPKSTEVLGLDQRAEGLSTGYYSSGQYDRVRVTLSEEPPLARDLTGAAVAVGSPVQRTFTLRLPTPIVASNNEVLSETVILELDAAASLTSAGAGGNLLFNPILRVRVLGETEAVRVDSLRGRALKLLQVREIVVLGGVDPQHAHTGVNVKVALNQDTRFYDEGELEPVDEAEFALRLQGPIKLVSVSGYWTPAVDEAFGPLMNATSIRIVGQEDTPFAMLPSIVEGRVVGLGGAGNIQLRLMEISGNESLSGLLSMQADPETLAIAPLLDALILDEDGNVLTASELTAGARVEVTIDPPFTAGGPFATSSIVQLDAPKHRGTLMLDAAQLALFLAENEAAIESGAVLSSSTPVRLQPSGDAPVLDVVGRPALILEDLLPPLRVAVSGTLTGIPSDPMLDNASIVVRPGRLDGVVSGVNASGETFDASIETIHAPFGGSATSPPFQFVLAPGCVFEGEATSRGSFFALFNGLEPGESLAVTVAGLGTD